MIRVYADFNSRGEKDRSDKVALNGPGALSDVAQEASRIASGQVSGNRGRLRSRTRGASVRGVVRVGFLRDDELGFEALVVEDESSQDRIEIQRSLEFDTQDQATGMDTYCLVRSSGETYYGGVSDWAVRSSVLVLGLSAEAAAALQLPPRSEIPIDVGAELLEQHLGRLLAMAPMTT